MAKTSKRDSLLTTAWGAVAFGLLASLAMPVRADDRQLLRQSPSDPYMFILLDTSGSMNERPADSVVPKGSADDPTSKLYQAKAALYNALVRNPDIHYGFATFNQDNVVVRRKHWLYKPAAAAPWSASLRYPSLNVDYLFGGEDGGGNSALGSCNSPLDLGTASSTGRDRVEGWPRTGDSGTLTHVFWLKDGSSGTYRFETSLFTGALGDATIQVRVRRRRVSNCSGPSYSSDEISTLQFNLTTDTVAATNFSDDLSLNSATWCSGMDPNSDSASDRYRYPTAIDLAFPTNRKFDTGDFLPLDWRVSNRDELLRRMAPNLRMGEITPDFRIARYLSKTAVGGTLPLTPAALAPNPDALPFLAGGNTPLGNSINSFRNWYAGCSNTAVCGGMNGWKDVADDEDPDWNCRKKYLLILTDGAETCGGGNETGPACQGAKVLYETYGITTFVIYFGQVNAAAGGNNVHVCMALNGSGGTIPPFNPTDAAGLDAALAAIFERVTQESRSFASAAVPTVQAQADDKIFVPSFTPLNASSFTSPSSSSPGAGATWNGHLDAFLKPLPINASTGKPDTVNSPCNGTRRSGCHLWDTALTMLTQSPTPTEVALVPPTLKIGAADGERRMFYNQASTGSTVPVQRRLFQPQTGLADQEDLWRGMGLTVADTSNAAAVATANGKVLSAIKYTLVQKTATVDVVAGVPTVATFVLGDIFHSSPVLLSSPARLAYYDNDLEGAGGSCATGANKGYRCFFERHQFRRKLLTVGSNDGQLHFFDAGTYDSADEVFNNGTGREVLSIAPRALLPMIYRQATIATKQDWGVDGTIQADDVFIDPSHTGTPTAADREWRSIVIGSLREGGSSVFAVDVTQPDRLTAATSGETPNLPQVLGTYVPSCWNGGTLADCGPVPFGSILWEFTDTSDSDSNGKPDLGDTWSTPNTGRIVLSDASGNKITKYVAIFGGGMDPERSNSRGNFLYMVDIETGKLLYKRQLNGSAPSEPAAVDTNLDGNLDAIYIGTTAGYLYKVDLRSAALLNTATTPPKVTAAEWEPYVIFDTVTGGDRLPIYYPPSVTFVARTGRFALGFGTGDREDLWRDNDLVGRYYFLVDEDFRRGDSGLPKREADYPHFTPDGASVSNSLNYLIQAATGYTNRGWILDLADSERLLSKSLALSGILTFTTFDPLIEIDTSGICRRAGISNIYTVFSTNANAILGASKRRRIRSYVTNPFIETSVTKNPPPTSGGGGGGGGGGGPEAKKESVCKFDPLTAPRDADGNPINVAKVLQANFPTGCRFTSWTQDVKTFLVDTQEICIAPIPVCAIDSNWKEN